MAPNRNLIASIFRVGAVGIVAGGLFRVAREQSSIGFTFGESLDEFGLVILLILFLGCGMLILAGLIEKSVSGVFQNIESKSGPGQMYFHIKSEGGPFDEVSIGMKAGSFGERLELVWFHMMAASRCMIDGGFGITVLMEKKGKK